MPELPEIFLAAQTINRHSKGIIFDSVALDDIIAAAAAATSELPWWQGAIPFSIHAESRGKELRITLIPHHNNRQTIPPPVYILFRLGLVGKFVWMHSSIGDDDEDEDDNPAHTTTAFRSW